MLVSYLPLRRSETSIFISVKCKDIEESLKKMWTKILKLIWWNEIAQSQSKLENVETSELVNSRMKMKN